MFRNALLMKPPHVGSSKGMHQDAPYWPIEPQSECSCWFALDDATPENGCMGVLPGAHKRGAQPHTHVTDDYVIEKDRYSMDDLVLAPVKAGGGLFFHALLPHYTAPNSSDHWRRAIALSYMSARSRYTGGRSGAGVPEHRRPELSRPACADPGLGTADGTGWRRIRGLRFAPAPLPGGYPGATAIDGRRGGSRARSAGAALAVPVLRAGGGRGPPRRWNGRLPPAWAWLTPSGSARGRPPSSSPCGRSAWGRVTR